MSSLAVGLLKIVSRNESSMIAIDKEISKKLSQELNAPTLGIDLVNGTLYIDVYPAKPFRLSKIILQFYNGSLKMINEKTLIEGPTRIPLIHNYSCQKLRVLLMTDEGVIYPYIPSKDPRFFSLNTSLKEMLLKKQWVDCELINTLLNAENSSEEVTKSINTNVNDKDPLTGSEMLFADPPQYSVIGNVSLGDRKLDLYFDGVISSNYMFVGVSFNGKTYTLGCGSTVTLGYLTNNVKVEAGGMCNSNYAALYIDFVPLSSKANVFNVYVGNVSTSASISYSGYYWVPLDKNHMVVPMELSEISNFTSYISGYEREYYSTGDYVISLRSSSKGNFMTGGPVILFYTSISYTMRLTMKTNITISYVLTVRTSNESFTLPIKGPIHYRLKPIKSVVSDALSSLAQRFFVNNGNNYPLLNISFGNVYTYRTIGPEEEFLPAQNVTYSIVIPPFSSLPYLTAVSIIFNSNELYTSTYFEYKVSWTLKTKNIPTGMGLPYPYLIYINDTKGGKYLIIASRNLNNITISQLGEDFGEYSILLSGINVTMYTERGTAFKVYAIRLSDEGYYLEAGTSIVSPSVIYLGTLTSGDSSLELSIPKGIYLIVLVPYNLKKNFLDLIVIITYVF